MESHVQLLSSTGEILPDSLKKDFSLIVKAQLEDGNACHAGLVCGSLLGKFQPYLKALKATHSSFSSGSGCCPGKREIVNIKDD